MMVNGSLMMDNPENLDKNQKAAKKEKEATATDTPTENVVVVDNDSTVANRSSTYL